MREYKFRAWDRSAKRMYHVADMSFGSEGCLIVRTTDGNVFTGLKSAKEYELMQYTGLKDKNGKEIYEGDIIKAKTFNYPLCIEWDRGECAFVMRSTHSGATYGFMWEIEIIGNIYDNPELLKEVE